MRVKQLVILGIRGLPARHGGFETFAERLCLFLVDQGWDLIVYCQEKGQGELHESTWRGVKRIHIPTKNEGPLGTILFDLKSVWHARKYKSLHLTLGYNTACVNIVQRIYRIRNVMNMDGIEWKRQKWGRILKAWFWLNERFGCWFANHLIADHPLIEAHLATRASRDKITMIPYGAIRVSDADESLIDQYGVEKNNYSIVIARPEPENSILEIVKAFCTCPRKGKLLVLGSFFPDSNHYHREIFETANDSVIFPGAIYDADIIAALRFYSRFYIHGHQVGGTNPSLVEALGAGCAVVAHDNPFNRWVTNESALYFSGVDHLSNFFSGQYLEDDYVEEKKAEAVVQFQSGFEWDDVLRAYEAILSMQQEIGAK